MAPECDCNDDGTSPLSFHKDNTWWGNDDYDGSNNTHTGDSTASDTSLTIDKRASLALDRIWPTSLHIKLLALHTLTLYGHLHLHLNAATELQSWSASLTALPGHGMPCWLHHDFSGLPACCWFSFQLATSLPPCLFTAARIDWKIMHLPWRWATMETNAKLAGKATIANGEIRAIGTPNLICFTWHRCITRGATHAKGFLTCVAVISLREKVSDLFF